jgi:hypothetical protein
MRIHSLIIIKHILLTRRHNMFIRRHSMFTRRHSMFILNTLCLLQMDIQIIEIYKCQKNGSEDLYLKLEFHLESSLL